MLRYAPRFHRKKNSKKIRPKIFQKKFPKKNSKKNIQKKYPKKISKKKFQFFFPISKNQKKKSLNSYACNRGSVCENLGGLGPLVWEEIENAQTVVKGLAKSLYRLF
jgi:hypothetical protein